MESSSLRTASAGGIAPTADLRIGVAGFGRRGQLAALAHRPGEGSRVTLVFDPSEGSRVRVAERLEGAVATDRFEDLLEADLDGVFVTSPDFLHEEQAVALLEAGKAVFLEKPMASTLRGADRILETAARTGSRLYVGHNMRHMPFVPVMKRLIDEGRIGEVKAVWVRHYVGNGGEFFYRDWHAERKNVTSLLLQKAAHDIDIIHYLAGGYSTRVNAMGGLVVYGDLTDRRGPDEETEAWYDETDGRWRATWPPRSLKGLHPVTDVEDLSMMQMELDNGVFASYQECNFSPDYWRNYVVIGTEGKIENFGNGEPGTRVEVWDHRHRGWQAQPDETIEIPFRAGGHHGADPMMVPEFLEYVRSGAPTSTSPLSARWAVAAGYSATKSMREGGRPVDVPAPPVGTEHL
jgi:predicted dehydrogenase